MNISKVQNVWDKIPTVTTIQDFYNDVKSNQDLKEQTELIRSLYNNQDEIFKVEDFNGDIDKKYKDTISGKDLYIEMKKRMPGVIFTGVNPRKQAFAGDFTKLMCIDYDNVKNIEKTRSIINSKNYTFLNMRSVTDGLKLVVRCDLSLNIGSKFHSKLSQKYNEETDPTIKKDLEKKGMDANNHSLELEIYKTAILELSKKITNEINESLNDDEKLSFDESNKDFTQVTLYSSDKNIFINENSEILKVNDFARKNTKLKKHYKKESQKQAANEVKENKLELSDSNIKPNDFINVLDSIIKHFKKNPTNTFLREYDEWCKFGFILFNILQNNDLATEYFRKFSNLITKCDDYGFNKMVNDIIQYDTGTNTNNIYPLLKIAKKHGYVGYEQLKDVIGSIIPEPKKPATIKLEENEYLINKLPKLDRTTDYLIDSPTGTGKTSGIVETYKDEKFVVACPNISNLKSGKKHCPNIIYGSGIPTDINQDQCLVTFDSLWKIENKKDKSLIIDEAHLLPLAYGYRDKAINNVIHCIKNKEFKQTILMTGTMLPIPIPLFDDFERIKVEKDSTDELMCKIIGYNGSKLGFVLNYLKTTTKNTILFWNNKHAAEQFAKKLKEELNIETFLYNADTCEGDEQKKTIENMKIDEKFRVAIFTSSLETGSDLNNENFDTLFVMDDQLAASVNQVQSRFRKKRPTPYILINKDKLSRPDVIFDEKKIRNKKEEIADDIIAQLDLRMKNPNTEKDENNIKRFFKSLENTYSKNNHGLVEYNGMYNYKKSEMGIDNSIIKEYKIISHINYKYYFQDLANLGYTLEYEECDEILDTVKMKNTNKKTKKEKEQFIVDTFKKIEPIYNMLCKESVIDHLIENSKDDPFNFEDQTKRRIAESLESLSFEDTKAIFFKYKTKSYKINQTLKQINNYYNIQNNQLPDKLKEFKSKYKVGDILNVNEVNQTYQMLMDFKVDKKLGLKILKELFNIEDKKIRGKEKTEHRILIKSDLNFNLSY